MKIYRLLQNPLSIILLGPLIGGVIHTTLMALIYSGESNTSKGLYQNILEYAFLTVFLGYFFGTIPAIITAFLTIIFNKCLKNISGYIATIILAGVVSWLCINVLINKLINPLSTLAFFAGAISAAITSYFVFFPKKVYT